MLLLSNQISNIDFKREFSLTTLYEYTIQEKEASLIGNQGPNLRFSCLKIDTFTHTVIWVDLQNKKQQQQKKTCRIWLVAVMAMVEKWRSKDGVSVFGVCRIFFFHLKLSLF